jgi:hypothetical protein
MLNYFWTEPKRAVPTTAYDGTICDVSIYIYYHRIIAGGTYVATAPA